MPNAPNDVRFENSLSGIVGSGIKVVDSSSKKPPIPKSPRIRGTSVRKEDQEYCVPPHVSAMRTATTEAIRRALPPMSARLRELPIVSFLYRVRKKMKSTANETAQMGTFR